MIISKTPYRVDLVGDGTDIRSFCNKERGCIINATITKYVYIAIHPSKDKKIRIVCEHNKETVENVDEIKEGRVRESLKKVGVFRGIEIHSISDAQTGTGLGGSSSFTVGLLNALYRYMGETVTKEKIAKEACEIEIEILGEPIGGQDQYAAAYGGFNRMDFIGEKVVVSKLIENEELRKNVENKIMMFYLGGERKTSSILTEQSKEIKNNQRVFDDMKNMRDLADYASFEIKRGEIHNFGKFFKKNWDIKKKLIPGINNPETEKYYNLAIESGAEGVKLSGAGGTGFLLIYAPSEKQEDIREALKKLEEHKFEFEEEGSKIIYSELYNPKQLILNCPKKETINMIKGIAFDLEGTVVDLEKLHHDAHLEVFRRVGLNLSVGEAIEKIEHFIGGPDRALMEDVHNLGYQSMPVKEMLDLDKELYEEQLRGKEIFPRLGFLKFLKKIKELGIPYSIGSLTTAEQANIILSKSGLYDYFPREKIVLREHVQNLKPAPDVYLETAKRMGINPSRQLVFEDSHNGVKAAIVAGSKAIGMPVYNTSFIIDRLLESGAFQVFSSWEKIDLLKLLEEISKSLL